MTILICLWWEENQGIPHHYCTNTLPKQVFHIFSDLNIYVVAYLLEVQVIVIKKKKDSVIDHSFLMTHAF